ncbi:MAG: tetratricopeptide repeat protein [Proteobacteria bacterium]|nr:tetratricopeptide repeat protein [Pseudomonadota bacterium]
MRSYSVRDVERVLQLAPDTTRALVRAGFVQPSRGARRELLFSFQDMIVLRTARALLQANVPARRVHRSLEALRRSLPQQIPLSGLAISAVGEKVVVRDGAAHWQAETGQYLLGLDVSEQDGELRVVEHLPQPRAQAAADDPQGPAGQAATVVPPDPFVSALDLEATDPQAALSAYRQLLDSDPRHAAAWTNLGRLLHEQGNAREAQEVYARALEQVGPNALLLFNRAVALEDLGRPGAALEAYHQALEVDPELADCHFNIARLYEALGRPQHAIRHLGQYRRLLGEQAR